MKHPLLTRIERMLDPAILANSEAFDTGDEDLAEDPAEAPVVDTFPEDAAATVDVAAPSAPHHRGPPDAIDPAILLQSLRVERTETGAMRIEAPPETAETLATLFETMATLMRSMATIGRPTAGGEFLQPEAALAAFDDVRELEVDA